MFTMDLVWRRVLGVLVALTIGCLATAIVAEGGPEDATAPAIQLVQTSEESEPDAPEVETVVKTATLTVLVVIGGDGEGAGAPIGAAEITIKSTTGVPLARTSTRANGKARISELAYGRVRILAVKSGYDSNGITIRLDSATHTQKLKLLPVQPPEG